MRILKDFFQNTRKPKGFGGRLMLSIMNIGHNKLALWGLSQVKIPPAGEILEIGCGGGRNIKNLLDLAPQGKVTGIDYSPESVARSKRTNKKAIAEGRAEVRQASVSSLPFADGSFDIATAFETVYFWTDILNDFMEVRRVLKPGGLFLICNELARPEGSEKWTKMLNLNIYTAADLSRILSDAGFENCACFEHSDGKWLCVTAQKPLSVKDN